MERQIAVPSFTDSEYFVPKPDWHIKPEAPDDLKEEFEKWANAFYEDLEDDYPDVLNPYVTWEGKVISKN